MAATEVPLTISKGYHLLVFGCFVSHVGLPVQHSHAEVEKGSPAQHDYEAALHCQIPICGSPMWKILPAGRTARWDMQVSGHYSLSMAATCMHHHDAPAGVEAAAQAHRNVLVDLQPLVNGRIHLSPQLLLLQTKMHVSRLRNNHFTDVCHQHASSRTTAGSLVVVRMMHVRRG